MGILITCNPILAPTHPPTLRDAYVTPTPVTLPRLPTDDRSPQELEVFFGVRGTWAIMLLFQMLTNRKHKTRTPQQNLSKLTSFEHDNWCSTPGLGTGFSSRNKRRRQHHFGAHPAPSTGGFNFLVLTARMGYSFYCRGT